MILMILRISEIWPWNNKSLSIAFRYKIALNKKLLNQYTGVKNE